MPYSVVDLFAGAGGLSLGFVQTGKYEIKVAFEREPHMQATYHRNHPNVELQGDVCGADYADIQRRHGAIDVVIGGPPCQGFSNANRQKNHAISQNNMLVKQYIRAIRELQPKAFVMENVSMLRSDVHRFYMEETDLDIVEEYQIPNKNTPLHLLSSEFVFDGALEIVQNLELLQQRLWPENHYRELNIIYKGEKNADKMKKSLEKHRRKLTEIAQAYIEDDADNYIAQKSREAFQAIMDYFDGILEADRIHTLIEPAIMIQRMLSKAREIFDNHIHVDSYECTEKDGLLANIRSFAVFDYLKGILTSGEDGYAINSGVLCAADFGAPQKRERFVVMGIKKSISAVVFLPSRKIKDGHYKTVHDAIYDLEDVPPVYDLADDEEGIPLEHKEQLSSVAQQLRDSDILKNHIITKTTDVAMARFKALHQGENFHSLEESLKTNTYTDVKRTQNTIYLRLNYNEPSGTVLNVRKSMWIHPTLDRAISIREAARLQTFPDSFVFCGSKDKQYQQVGNAVPPIMAKAIAKQLAATLGKNFVRQNKKMADNHSKEVRSKNMSHIRSTNSKPEEIVRKYLFSKGFRYRKNVRTLPGCPDIVLPKYHTMIFVNGCFWHKHDCGRFVWPSSNTEYWIPKINRNVERDKQNHKKLIDMGWKVLIIWECELKKNVREDRLERLIKEIKGE
jgi:DNA (cytosine-5)-methyltransferase 1